MDQMRSSALGILRCNIDIAEGETLLIMQRVIKLLTERGAKEEEWLGGKRVYPKRSDRSSLTPSWRSIRSGKAHSIELSASSKRNLLRRMVLSVKKKRTDEPEDQVV